MSEIILSVAIIWLTITNVYTLHILFSFRLLEKSKDLTEYNKIKEKPTKEKPEMPNIIETPIY